MTAASNDTAPMYCASCGVQMFGSFIYLYDGAGARTEGPYCGPCASGYLQARGLWDADAAKVTK